MPSHVEVPGFGHRIFSEFFSVYNNINNLCRGFYKFIYTYFGPDLMEREGE